MQFTFSDCHVHTEFSACGEDVALQGYADFARTSEMVFAITDHAAHIFYPPGHAWSFWTEDAVALYEANRQSGRQRIEDYLSLVRAAQGGGMLVGTELDILPDGRPVFPDDIVRDLDVVLGAVHSLPTLRAGRPLQEVVAEYQFQAGVLAEMNIDILAHPFRTMLGADCPVPQHLLEWLVALAADAGFALEINSHKRYAENDLALMRLALEAGVTLATGTDSHRRSEFGDFSYHAEMLERAGVPTEQWPGILWEYKPAARQAAAGQ